MQIDVRPDHLEIIKNALKLHVPDRKVVAFGSRVKWTARDTSDLDLCVMGDDKISFETLAALRNELSDSNLPYKVDVIDWASIAPDFRQIIDQRNEEIQKPIKELKFISVGQFSPFIYGKSLPETTRNTQGSVPVYGSSGFVGRHDKALTNGPTVIIGRKGTIGKVTYSTSPCWPIDTTFFVEGSADRNIRYTYYALKSLGLEQMNSDSAVPGLNRDNAHARVLPKRSFQEQTKIADILSALDDKIELNNKMNETLEATAQALFKSWFVDFEPVKAKMEGRKPEGLTADLAGLFPDSLENGTPKGWTEESIYSCAEYINGAAYKNMHFSEAEDALPVIKIVELKNGIGQGTKYTNTDLGKKYLMNTGEVLFSWSGSPETSIDTFLWVGGKAWLNQHIFKVLTKSAEMRTFVFFLLKHMKPVFIETAKNKQTSGLGHVTIQDLKRLKTTCPSNDVLKAFSKVATPILDSMQYNLQQGVVLSRLRDSLLPKLISGELRVGDAASKIKEAV